MERGEFAMAATDMGHRDPSAASWGGDPERRLDFAHRAQHLTVRAAKLLIARFYGEGPRRSYFSGCSDGGREALLEALFHPEDFDGIAAGAPALDWTAQNTFHHAWTVQRNRRADDGSAAPTADRLPVPHRLVLAACGGGGAGGVVARQRQFVHAEAAEYGVQDQVAFDAVTERLPGPGLQGIARPLVQPEQSRRELDPPERRGVRGAEGATDRGLARLPRGGERQVGRYDPI